MRRPHLIALILIGVLLFLAISALLARVLSVDSAERAAITSLVQAEARGDGRAMIEEIQNCGRTPACRRRVIEDALALSRRGRVAILELDPSAGFSLSSTIGTARVAWRAGNGLPIVQCVRVHRAGNVLSGLRVELLEISLRIKPSSAACPRRY
jgi:hypothetical protein